MAHALFVAFHYPPEASSSGVLRTLKYTRYLGDHGWRVTVITPRIDAYEVTDAALEAQVPASVRVVRTPYLNTKRHLSIRGRHPALLAVPDRWIGWWPWGVAAGRRIFAADPFDLVYSTSPHATAHLIAQSVARRHRRPSVVDFRDPWYEDPPEPGTTRLQQWAAARLERRVVSRAARVVASTDRLRAQLRSRYAQEPAAKFAAIANGFDEADFASLPPRSGGRSAELLIVHAGSLNSAFRDPRPVLASLRREADRGRIDLARVRLRFLGGGPFAQSPEIGRAVDEHGLAGRVDFTGRVSYDRALAEMAAADMLLLLQASPDTVDLVPAKLFEYLKAGRPVLAVVHEGATGETLAEVAGGWAVDPRDGEGLGRALATVYEAWTQDRLAELAAPPDRLERFSRRRLAAELARHLDAVLGESRP